MKSAPIALYFRFVVQRLQDKTITNCCKTSSYVPGSPWLFSLIMPPKSMLMCPANHTKRRLLQYLRLLLLLLNSLLRGFHITQPIAILILLWDNYMVKVTWHLHSALFAVRSVSYAKWPLHARLKSAPRVDGMSRPSVAPLRWWSAWRLDIHSVSIWWFCNRCRLPMRDPGY